MPLRAIFRILLGASIAFFMIENAGVGWDSLDGLAVLTVGALFGLGCHWLKSIESSSDAK